MPAASALVPDALPVPHLVLDGVGHRFGRRVLFRQLALELGAGEAVSVTGANGAGKSTLVRIVAGVLTPYVGAVTLSLDGRAVEPERRPLAVGLVAPYLNVYEGLTARENLQFIARARGLPRPAARIGALLDAVGLPGRADERVAVFSSGMRQRVRLAAALLGQPSLLLLDEPTSNLDDGGRAVVAEAVRAQRAAGGAVLLATNDPAEAALCERTVCVDAAPVRA